MPTVEERLTALERKVGSLETSSFDADDKFEKFLIIEEVLVVSKEGDAEYKELYREKLTTKSEVNSALEKVKKSHRSKNYRAYLYVPRHGAGGHNMPSKKELIEENTI